MDTDTVFLVGAWIALVVLALGYAGLLRAVNSLTALVGHDTARGRLTGRPAPPIGEYERFSTPTVVLFASHECMACREIVPRLRRVLIDIDPRLKGLVVYRDGEQMRLADPEIEAVIDPRAFDEYEVELVPTAIFIETSGSIAAADPVGSLQQLEEFVRSAQKTSKRKEGVEA